MDALYELLALMPPGFRPQFSPKLNELYLFLTETERLTPRKAAKQFLGSEAKLKYFNNLRRELKTLLTRYLVAHPSWVDNKNKALIEDCYRRFAAYKILLLSSKRKVAIRMAERLVEDLKKVDLHSLLHIVLQDLLLHYATVDVSSALVKKYNQLVVEQTEIIRIESIVCLNYSRIIVYCNKQVSYTLPVIDEIKKWSDEVWTLRKKGLHHINRMIYLIKINRYRVVYDYENILNYCDEALDSFPKDHPNIRSLSFIFLYHKVPALLALGRLEVAKQIARKASSLVPVGNFNWHIILLKRIVVCLHAGDYQEAYDIFKAHQQKKYPAQNIKEYWSIIRAYLYFLVRRGKIGAYEKERFYLGKFMNEVPIYSKDKSGNNINILIAQILINMQRERYFPIIDKIDSLRSYTNIHIKNPETKRANIFINMILKMEAASFIRIATERKTKNLLERLKALSLKMGQNLAIEIIPYEVLWEEILAMLDDKFRPSRRNLVRLKK